MSEKLQRNEKCIIGLPRCDYIFNSSRSCFIAYDFEESNLEMNVLKGVLTDHSIEVFEAGPITKPGKNAFCTKICSKIISSQFCIAILNDAIKSGISIPNANIYMEYGLMLGFSKYIIPFQKENQSLPFNVAGLDTVKYNNSNFPDKALRSIELAITETKPPSFHTIPPNVLLTKFLLTQDVFLSSISDAGEKSIYDLGAPYGYWLLNDFSGFKYLYLGIFTTHTMTNIKFRIDKLERAVKARFGSIDKKLELNIIDDDQYKAILEIFKNIEIWIIVQDKATKEVLEKNYTNDKGLSFKFYTENDIEQRIKELCLEE